MVVVVRNVEVEVLVVVDVVVEGAVEDVVEGVAVVVTLFWHIHTEKISSVIYL